MNPELEKVLLKVQKPGRYAGGESNRVVKDQEQVDVRFAFCFPDVYEIGMSHLGIQILYDLLNAREDVYCERVYSPWMDLDEVMRKKQIPLFYKNMYLAKHVPFLSALHELLDDLL
mgnify:CR=1 FL=1